jgi:hypothetical protein
MGDVHFDDVTPSEIDREHRVERVEKDPEHHHTRVEGRWVCRHGRLLDTPESLVDEDHPHVMVCRWVLELHRNIERPVRRPVRKKRDRGRVHRGMENRRPMRRSLLQVRRRNHDTCPDRDGDRRADASASRNRQQDCSNRETHG